MRRGRGVSLFSTAGAAVALLMSVSMVTASVFPYGTIVFVSDRDWLSGTPGSDIYTMNADGTMVTQVTNDALTERDPVLSPDGAKIAFVEGYDIWVMNADGSGVTNVTSCNPDPMSAWRCWSVKHPTWSPDGSRIAFAYRVAPLSWELDVIDADGTDRHPEYRYATWLGDPAWSPDGTQIAFAAGTSEATASIYLRTVGAPYVNTATALFPGRMPAWSPTHVEGSYPYHYLAYVNNSGATYGDDVYIATVCADCAVTPGWSYFPAPGRDWNPSWSTDATKVLFQSERWHSPAALNDADAVFHLYVADPFNWDDPYPEYYFGDLDLSVYSDVFSGSGTGTITYSDTMASWHWPLYDISGFFSPVADWNGLKAGKAVPIKFSLGGDQGLDIFAADYPKAVPIACGTDDPSGSTVETVTAGGSSLTYDAVADQYIYVWKTDKGWAGKCRELQVQFRDGTFVTAKFSFWR